MRFVAYWRYLPTRISPDPLVKRSRNCLYVTVCILLSGCATTDLDQPLSLDETQLTESTLAQDVGEAQPGDKLVFDSATIMGTNTIIVGGEYSAASGRTCKRLLNESGTLFPRVVCQLDGGSWYLAKRLVTQIANARLRISNRARSRPVVQIHPAINADAGSATKRRFVFKRGETLWSFAKRTTGNAYNWKEIARFNHIDDETDLDAGTFLVIPPGMNLSDS